MSILGIWLSIGGYRGSYSGGIIITCTLKFGIQFPFPFLVLGLPSFFREVDNGPVFVAPGMFNCRICQIPSGL